MYDTKTMWQNTYPWTFIETSCLGYTKFTRFYDAKTSVNKRLLNTMCSLFYAAEFSEITMRLLIRTQFACKGTTFFWYMQIIGGFFGKNRWMVFVKRDYTSMAWRGKGRWKGGISDPPRLADTRRKCRVSERRGERTGIRCRDKEQRKGKGRWSGRWHRPEYMDRCHFERTMISSWKRRKLLSRINVRCINAIWFGEIAPKSGQMRRAGRGDDESVRGWKEGKRGWKEDEERETNKSDLLHPLLFCPAEEFKRQMAIPVRMFW